MGKSKSNIFSINLDWIKENVNLIEYAKTHYGINCNSKGYARCPFCKDKEDKNPSFQIWQHNGKWGWTDWHFGEGHPGFTGTIVDLVMKIENKTNEEACKKLLEQHNPGESIKRKSGKRTEYIYKDFEGKVIYKKVKIKDDSGNKTFFFEHKTKDGWKPEKGDHELIPYNLNEIHKYTRAIICEGEKDADNVKRIVEKLELDYWVTSAPTGKGSWPDSLTPYFKDIVETILLYDVGAERDTRNHAAKLQAVFPNMKIYIAKLPMEEKEADITDYLEREDDKQMAFLDIQKHAVRFELKNKQEGKPGPILISLDSIDPEPVQWLWHNRIPLGKLSLIVGDPGNGKSFLLIYLAAHITAGEAWSDFCAPIHKGSVVILTAEDGLADTVRVRADAAGADVSRIKILEGIINKEGEQEYFNLVEHLPALEQAIKETNDVLLVGIDPITAYLGNIDSHKNSSVRGALAPLASLAEKYKTAVIGITHLNKKIDTHAIYRPMGSLAFTAAARSVWAVARDENDETMNRRFFTPLKTNLSINPTSLAFSIIENRVIFEKIPVEIDAEEALSREKSEETSALSNAVTWLKEALEDGPVPSADIFRMAKENHITEATLRRAKEKLNVCSDKEGMAQQGKWFWRLSDKQ